MARRVTSGTLANSFDRRSLVIGALQGGVGLLLATRMGWIAIAENGRYQMMSESNRVNLSLIPPRRGWIVDRHGQPMASNRADFRVDLIPERLIDVDRTIDELAPLIGLDAIKVQEIKDRLEEARGYRPVEAASHLDEEKYAAVSVRMPDLPGVVPQRSFARAYPNGPSVGHLIGYVGPASAADYEKERNPLLITPGFKVGKDGLEKQFDSTLRGVPGARRVEVTAGGRIVRDLDTREDIPGQTLKLTIDAQVQDFASRRIGLESASVVVIDCLTGGILALCSMPSFDPNSFADGVGRLEWKMLQEDDHIPLLNKAIRGLYPPGSTMKPMATLALQLHGVDPAERVSCPGGYRLGRRFFRCDAVHGSVDMRGAIEHSCNTYFWSMAHRVGYDAIAPVARQLGLGQQFDLPVSGQRKGIIPDAAWKMRRYKQAWSAADSLNASIGQGYVAVSPLQLAVMTARIATGRPLQPSLLHGRPMPPGAALPFTPEQLAVTHEGMFRVVNGGGTATGSKLQIGDVRMAGKTGTAQVRALGVRKALGEWKTRDHSLFIGYAPTDAPRYAMSVVVEHGTFGARAAAPIARDVMTLLFDPPQAWARLLELEKQWGGTAAQRLAAKFDAYAARYGTNVPKVGPEEAVEAAMDRAPAPANPGGNQDVIVPADTPQSTEPGSAQAKPAPSPSPGPSPSPATPR